MAVKSVAAPLEVVIARISRARCFVEKRGDEIRYSTGYTVGSSLASRTVRIMYDPEYGAWYYHYFDTGAWYWA